jgi:hypothetical protein
MKQLALTCKEGLLNHYGGFSVLRPSFAFICLRLPSFAFNRVTTISKTISPFDLFSSNEQSVEANEESAEANEQSVEANEHNLSRMYYSA